MGMPLMADQLVEVQVNEEFADLVDAPSLATVAAQTLTLHMSPGAAPQEPYGALMTVVITDDETVRRLNRRYRGMDSPTDVLSFAAQEAPHGWSGPGNYLGDILIAYPYACRQAERYGNRVDSELRLLTVHGALHLLGFDHATAAQEAAMWAQQDRVLAHFGDPGVGDRRFEP